MDPPWTRFVAWGAAGFLGVATLIWSSGGDMFIGLLMLLVLGGWGALGLWGFASFVRAARTRPIHWLRDWATVWLGCAVALLGSVAIGVTGAPEAVRIDLSRKALVDAGNSVLAGEHPDRAGLYGFSETRVSGDCALLETGTFAIDSFGFAYCPKGNPGGFEDLGGGLFKYYYG